MSTVRPIGRSVLAVTVSLVLRLAVLPVFLLFSGCTPRPQPASGTGPRGSDAPPGRPVFVAAADYAAAQLAAYAGAESCRSCHPEAYAQWTGSRHARSLQSLRREGSEAEPRCLRCHATLLLPPGAEAPQLDQDTGAVGCEACHGPARRHAEAFSPTRHTIDGVRSGCSECNFRGICQTCHGKECDPDFDFFTAYEAVRHDASGASDRPAGGEVDDRPAGGDRRRGP